MSCTLMNINPLNFLKKKRRMRIWHAVFFLSLLAGKLGQFEQGAAGKTRYANRKKKPRLQVESANIKPVLDWIFAHEQKGKIET